MADEVTDPLEAVLTAHVAKINAIVGESIAKTQALCDESLLGVKKKTGLRSQLLDKILESLEIVEPKPQ